MTSRSTFHVSFETAIIERYRRKESSVEEALIEMYLAGAKKVEDGVEETLTYADFPSEHWTRIRINKLINYIRYWQASGILEREQYTGRLIWGDRRSDDLPELKIISTETFAVAQQIAGQRKTRQIPQKVSGQALLSGNVYCGHCGG